MNTTILSLYSKIMNRKFIIFLKGQAMCLIEEARRIMKENPDRAPEIKSLYDEYKSTALDENEFETALKRFGPLKAVNRPIETKEPSTGSPEPKKAPATIKKAFNRCPKIPMEITKQFTKSDFGFLKVIENHMFDWEAGCYPSFNTIIKESGLSRKSVAKARKHLVDDLKVLKIEEKYIDNKNQKKRKPNNVYFWHSSLW